jgi:hypothetical protein
VKKMLQKPSSAPVRLVEGINMNRTALQRRSTGNCKRKQKSIKMPSSSSLHSLVSILKATPTDTNQRSVPNVSFDSDCNEIKLSDSVNDEKTTKDEHIAVECDGPINSHAEGSFSTQQSSTIGLRASLFSVLTKLGVWRSEDLYKAPASDGKFPSDKRTARSSVTSLYLRSLYGGNEKYYFDTFFFR